MKIGYARCSTNEQNLHLQYDALHAAGCDRIFRDEGISAVAAERPGFKAAIGAVGPGDSLVIWMLDRAFRSTVEAILLLDELRGRGVEFQCLMMHIDTSTPEGRKWYRDTASWAEYERELISQRTKAGMMAAKRRGRHLGRPRLLDRHKIETARKLIESGEENQAGAAALLGVSISTLRRHLRKGVQQALEGN